MNTLCSVTIALAPSGRWRVAVLADYGVYYFPKRYGMKAARALCRRFNASRYDEAPPSTAYADRGVEDRSTPIRQIPTFAGMTDTQICEYLA